MSGEVILGFDGSDGARHAVGEAVAMARAFDSTLILAFGYEPPVTGGEVADLRKAVEARGEEVLRAGAKLAAEADASLPIETILVDERPADSLADLAAQRGARVIVVGHGGMGPIKGAVLGSVTYRILHSAPCPVLVVKAPEANQRGTMV
jgi:nucleotide-binding universal stress UspA family protein